MIPKVLIPSLLLTLSWLSAAPSAAANELQRLVDAGLAAGENMIRIPPGRYEVAPTNGVHLALRGVTGVTIDATGVEMVCTETTLALHVVDCDDAKVIGLTIDYDPLPFTQGRIVEIDPDRKGHVIEIMEGFPDADAAYVFKHSIYTAEGELRYGSYYNNKLEVLGPRRLRIHGLNPRVDGGQQVGDIVIVSTQHLSGRYVPHAVTVDDSRGTVLDGVTIYSSPCFGFFEQGSSGSIYRNCVIDRREGRVHSLNADAFHSKYAEVGPQILDCRAMWQGDDCVNICGDYLFVLGAERDSVRVGVVGKMRFEVGDTVQIVDVEGRRLEDATATAVRPAGGLTPEERALIARTNLHRSKANRIERVYEVVIDREIVLPPGSVIASENRMGSGFVVRGNTFGNNRSRGILVKASHGEISGNRLINTHMQSILVAPEYYWLESGFSTGLKVEGNTIINPLREAIAIKGIGPHPGHRQVEVTGNSIRGDFAPAIRFESVRGGLIADNAITTTKDDPLENALLMQHCEEVESH